ncbi:MAG: hypothetical protein ACREBG_29440, partial [Pyrinomonadaceae bacterium]
SKVAESAQPASELQLGWLSYFASALRARPTMHCGASAIQFGRVTLGLHAGASIYEEPGAGKLHAGICAGAVG